MRVCDSLGWKWVNIMGRRYQKPGQPLYAKIKSSAFCKLQRRVSSFTWRQRALSSWDATVILMKRRREENAWTLQPRRRHSATSIWERDRKHESGGLTAVGNEKPRAGDDRETPLSWKQKKKSLWHTVWSATVMTQVSLAPAPVGSLNTLWVCAIIISRPLPAPAVLGSSSSISSISIGGGGRLYWLQAKNTPSVNKFKSHIQNKVVDMQLRGGWLRATSTQGSKGSLLYTNPPSPSLPLRFLDNCNLPQSDSANRWPWRPTGRSCSLSMSSRSRSDPLCFHSHHSLPWS